MNVGPHLNWFAWVSIQVILYICFVPYSFHNTTHGDQLLYFNCKRSLFIILYYFILCYVKTTTIFYKLFTSVLQQLHTLQLQQCFYMNTTILFEMFYSIFTNLRELSNPLSVSWRILVAVAFILKKSIILPCLELIVALKIHRVRIPWSFSIILLVNPQLAYWIASFFRRPLLKFSNPFMLRLTQFTISSRYFLI